jgi:glycosyltransferase involved in cell wall biosynthesis
LLPAQRLIFTAIEELAIRASMENTMELISVIIPAYNTEKFIPRALDSVIAQTYQNIEVIVVDDGSKDATVAVARGKLQNEFNGPWQVIELEANRGPNVARNVAWRAAKGSWIQSLDSDDFLAPSKLEKQASVCSSVADNVALVYSPRQHVYIDGEKVEPVNPNGKPNLEYRNKAPIALLGSDGYLLHQAGLLRRSVLERVGGFDETMRVFEEIDLLVRIASEGWRFEFVPSNEPLYFWRYVRGQARMGDAGARYDYVESALNWMQVALKATGRQPLHNFELSLEEKKDVLDSITGFVRGLHVRNRRLFHEYLAMARILVPDFIPSKPWHLAALTRCVGYENAETIAELARGPKKALLRAVRGA